MAKVMAKTVKLADIAAIVNVSTVTVSKALSDQKGVSDSFTKRRLGHSLPFIQRS